MDDEEDLKKMIAVLNSSKKKETDEFDFDDFVESEDSDIDNDLNANEISSEEDDELLTNLDTIDVFSIYKHDPISSLKPEEKDLIDQCEDPDLKRLLFLNRKKNINLILLYKKLQDLLMECRQYIIEKGSLLKEHINTLKANNLCGSTWRLAAPYFKDKDLYQSPQNDDTKRKRMRNELFIYDLGSTKSWSRFECEKLIKAVKMNYSFNRNQSLKAKLKEKGNLTSQQIDDEADEILTAQMDIPPLNSNEHIDWSRIATVFIQDKHTELECQSMWHLYLHPSINKSSFTNEENDRLKAIVQKYKDQNWKAIASELGTNRSELIVCKHYLSNLSEKFKKGEFSYEEDKKLLETVKRYKIGNYIQWSKVTRHFCNRTRPQLYHRYSYYLSQDSKKKGAFTKAEDIILMIFVDKFGRKFSKIDKYLPDRSLIQCKARFANNLQRTVNKGNWTLEEDEKIMEHAQEHGSQNWSKLTTDLSRSRGQLRQRYVRIKHFLDTTPNSNLTAIRRRGQTFKDTDRYAFCRTIANRFIDARTIPTLEEIEKILISENLKSDDSTPSDDDTDDYDKSYETFSEIQSVEAKHVDESLLEFFSTSYNASPTIQQFNEPEFAQGVNDIERILKCLKANVRIPDNFETLYADTLDQMDVKILRCLKNRKICDTKNVTTSQKYRSIQELVPPNFHTTMAMRSLLIQHLQFNRRKKDIFELTSYLKNPFSVIRQTVTNDIMNCSVDDRDVIESERNLFYRRFHSLLKWPSMMSLENPSPEVQNISDFLPVKKVAVKRTYSRVHRDQGRNEQDVKKSKPSTDPSINVLKLTPVSNGSVIRDLMNDKSKKLFSMNQINENGHVKTVINEIKLDFAGTKDNVTDSVVYQNSAASTSQYLSSTVPAAEERKVCVDVKDRSNSSEVSSMAKDLPVLVIKNDINDTEMLDVPSNLDDDDHNSISYIQVQDNSIRGEDDEDKCDLEKLNMFLKQNMNNSDSDSDISDIIDPCNL